MSNLSTLFEKLENLRASNSATLEQVESEIQGILNAKYKDWQALAIVIDQLERCEGIEYFIDEDCNTNAFKRFSELDRVESSEKLYFESYLDGYAMHVDWENECLYQCLGDEYYAIQNDSHRAIDNGVYLNGKQVMAQSEYTDENGEIDENLRNEMIEKHMAEQGCYPGVFRITQYGDIHPVNTQAKRAK